MDDFPLMWFDVFCLIMLSITGEAYAWIAQNSMTRKCFLTLGVMLRINFVFFAKSDGRIGDTK